MQAEGLADSPAPTARQGEEPATLAAPSVIQSRTGHDAMAEIPEGDLELDAWISDGQIVQFELDFVKAAEEFGDPAPEGVERLALRLEIDEFTDEIAAPEGATLIDPQQIFQGIFGGLGGLGAPAAPSGGTIPELGISCSDLEGLTEADVRAFLEGAGRKDLIDATKQACPELFD
jgi:hypothetical protein